MGHMRFIIILFPALAWLPGFAQYSVSGTVRDTEGRPLNGATVQVVDGKQSAVTDELGAFRLERMQAGNYSLVIRFLGYTDQNKSIDVPAIEPMLITMEETTTMTDEVIVRSTRAHEGSPTTYVNVDTQVLQKQNFGQDLPILLNWTPSVVTTSDAGTGIGYTGIRIRGSDATRVNVTINGIPYNDSESQATYWVDIPDVASSTQSVQIQRGVGTSTNGAGAFGASVNVQTNSVQVNPYAELTAAAGSFGTRRYTARAGTGLLKEKWTFDAKVSRITSDGYVERAFSDLTSFYVSGGYYSRKTMIKAIAFGGHEKTYQAWYGVDEATLQSDRRLNYAGAIYDDSGNITGYYNNQIDNYTQNHYQLHLSQVLTDRLTLTAAGHYTYGRGYYEEYQQGRTFASVGLPDYVQPDSTYTGSDMIVRKWLDNHFYGITFGLQYEGERSTFLLGGAVHEYSPAKHYGEIVSAQLPGSVSPGYQYYQGQSAKGDRNVFLRWNYQATTKLSFFADVQYRGVNYSTSGTEDDLSTYSVNDRFDFFNPKIGVTYSLNERSRLYASYGIVHREPNRSDYLEGTSKPRPEKLNNLEVGFRRVTSRFALDANYYLMQYTDQLVQTGAIDNAGYPIRANVGSSYRTGVELSGVLKFSERWTWNANATLSVNRNNDFVLFENNVPVLRNTTIILSPGLIAGSQLSWRPFAGFETTWLSKYVGSQFLDNTENASAKLSAYWINDLRLSYETTPKGFRAITWSLLVNNALDVTYSSNGYSYGGAAYYFPQAGRNFLAMMTVRF